ncbi:MAG TPA: glycosyltransferase family 1 protein [Thermoanaerobaculia bacterium]|nr:glycosyltransferase family 1 protein [Thermoanaerobaculia bacterium]
MPSARSVAVDLRALVPAATGIGVYTRSLLLALAARGGFRYLGMAHRPVACAGELAAAGVRAEHHGGPLGVVWQQLLLPRRLARGDVDLLWSPLFTLPLRCPVPGVVTVHDLTALLLPETHRWKVRWSLLPFLRPSLEAARRVIAVSHATAADLRTHFPQAAAKVRVVHSGIDPDFRPGEPDAVAATRRELGAPEGYLLYAGTLEPRKGLHLLLDAWESLRAQAPATPPLVLAGGYGWRSRDLVRRIERLRPAGVVALGHLPRARLVAVVQAARLFAYPSLYEGFGFPPAEALACGVPVVATRSSSLPEVVGDAGLLVEPADAGALATALAGVLADPALAADLAARGPARAARFLWARAAESTEEVFREALE